MTNQSTLDKIIHASEHAIVGIYDEITRGIEAVNARFIERLFQYSVKIPVERADNHEGFYRALTGRLYDAVSALLTRTHYSLTMQQLVSVLSISITGPYGTDSDITARFQIDHADLQTKLFSVSGARKIHLMLRQSQVNRLERLEITICKQIANEAIFQTYGRPAEHVLGGLQNHFDGLVRKEIKDQQIDVSALLMSVSLHTRWDGAVDNSYYEVGVNIQRK